MLTKIDGTVASDHLNLIRGLAAVAVLLSHVRHRFFLNYQDLVESDRLQQAFYVFTSFGHDFVMVFFVLSGFFISASVIRDCDRRRWSFKHYLTNRFVRLYVVLIPGLLLTVLWDFWGLDLFGGNAVYSGEPQPWQNSYFAVADRLGLEAFLGNLFFLQTIYVPPFGSNEPLWSLSNEFWYYILFPCLWIALFYRPVPRVQRLALLAASMVLMGALGLDIVLYFPIWLLGTLVSRLPLTPIIQRWSLATTATVTSLFGGCLLMTHWKVFRERFGESVVAVDYFNAIGFAVVLYVVLHCQQGSANGKYATFAKSIAGFSFTLYVVHLPLLVFAHGLLVPDRPWIPDPFHLGIGALISAATIGYAWSVAKVTEAKTDLVRGFVMNLNRLPKSIGNASDLGKMKLTSHLSKSVDKLANVVSRQLDE
jgi:peptidoglycan/LPS O-acetylase OafA/YrhL